jgi:hypothetical protein
MERWSGPLHEGSTVRYIWLRRAYLGLGSAIWAASFAWPLGRKSADFLVQPPANQDAGASNGKNDARAAILGKRRLARWITIIDATGAPVADNSNIMTDSPRAAFERRMHDDRANRRRQ